MDYKFSDKSVLCGNPNCRIYHKQSEHMSDQKDALEHMSKDLSGTLKNLENLKARVMSCISQSERLKRVHDELKEEMKDLEDRKTSLEGKRCAGSSTEMSEIQEDLANSMGFIARLEKQQQVLGKRLSKYIDLYEKASRTLDILETEFKARQIEMDAIFAKNLAMREKQSENDHLIAHKLAFCVKCRSSFAISSLYIGRTPTCDDCDGHPLFPRE